MGGVFGVWGVLITAVQVPCAAFELLSVGGADDSRANACAAAAVAQECVKEAERIMLRFYRVVHPGQSQPEEPFSCDALRYFWVVHGGEMSRREEGARQGAW